MLMKIILKDCELAAKWDWYIPGRALNRNAFRIIERNMVRPNENSQTNTQKKRHAKQHETK